MTPELLRLRVRLIRRQTLRKIEEWVYAAVVATAFFYLLIWLF